MGSATPMLLVPRRVHLAFTTPVVLKQGHLTISGEAFVGHDWAGMPRACSRQSIGTHSTRTSSTRDQGQNVLFMLWNVVNCTKPVEGRFLSQNT